MLSTNNLLGGAVFDRWADLPRDVQEMLLAAAVARDPTAAEHHALHAEHLHVPVDGGVDVPAVQHDVVDVIDGEGHTSRYVRLIGGPVN